MPTSVALRLCPKLIVVPHSHGIYGEYSGRVMTLLAEYGDDMQQISVDEAFLDLTGFSTDARALALEIQARIKTAIGLPASIGVASGKLVAKMASGNCKPNGVLVIAPGAEAAFLAPMAVGELWGIGAATATRLEAQGIRTIGDLQRADAERLAHVFHDQAASMIERAQGIDDSLVRGDREVKSISEETTFARDIRDAETLRKTLLHLSDRVAARLRSNGLHARTVHVKLRWQDFSTVTRQSTLAEPTQLGDEIFAAAEKLWLLAWQRGVYVRLIGVGVSGLTEGIQMSMFDDDGRAGKLNLARALDTLRAQYGADVVKRASLARKRDDKM